MKTVTMLTSCWQVLSKVQLRRIFDVRKRWANLGFACICEEKYVSMHEATRAIYSQCAKSYIKISIVFMKIVENEMYL